MAQWGQAAHGFTAIPPAEAGGQQLLIPGPVPACQLPPRLTESSRSLATGNGDPGRTSATLESWAERPYKANL